MNTQITNKLPDAKPNLLNVSNLNKMYPKKLALSGLNLTLEPGHIVGLLGPNGSGKTTLMKILTGVIKDYSGTVTINGMPVSPETKALVSYLPDNSYFSPWMTPLHMISMFKDFYADFSEDKCLDMPVSYTHLTLPTIYSV